MALSVVLIVVVVCLGSVAAAISLRKPAIRKRNAQDGHYLEVTDERIAKSGNVLAETTQSGNTLRDVPHTPNSINSPLRPIKGAVGGGEHSHVEKSSLITAEVEEAFNEYLKSLRCREKSLQSRNPDDWFWSVQPGVCFDDNHDFDDSVQDTQRQVNDAVVTVSPTPEVPLPNASFAEMFQFYKESRPKHFLFSNGDNMSSSDDEYDASCFSEAAEQNQHRHRLDAVQHGPSHRREVKPLTHWMESHSVGSNDRSSSTVSSEEEYDRGYAVVAEHESEEVER